MNKFQKDLVRRLRFVSVYLPSNTPGDVSGKNNPCVEGADEIERLEKLINNPHTDDFLEAVRLEAAHQIERWTADHDEGKQPQDWFWLLGYLAGKALASVIAGDMKKATHHTISSAAVLMNWHAAMTGVDTRMRPGIKEPKA